MAPNTQGKQGKKTRFRTESSVPPSMNTVFRLLDRRMRGNAKPLFRDELRGILESADSFYTGPGGQLDCINFTLNHGVLTQNPDRSFVFDPVAATTVRDAVAKGQALPYIRVPVVLAEEEDVPTGGATENPISSDADPEADEPEAEGEDGSESGDEDEPASDSVPVVSPVRKTRLAYLNRVGGDALEAIITCVELKLFTGQFPVSRINAEFCATKLGGFFARSVDAFLHCAEAFVTAGILAKVKTADAETDWYVFDIIGDLTDVKVVATEEFHTVRVPEVVLKRAQLLRSNPFMLPATVTDLDGFLRDVGRKFYGPLRRHGQTPDTLKVANDYGLRYCSWNPSNPEQGWGFLDIADDDTVLHCLPGLEAVTLESDGVPVPALTLTRKKVPEVVKPAKVEPAPTEPSKAPVEEASPTNAEVPEAPDAEPEETAEPVKTGEEQPDNGLRSIIAFANDVPNMSDEAIEGVLFTFTGLVEFLNAEKAKRAEVKAQAEAIAKAEAEAAAARAEAEAREAERIRLRVEKRAELQAMLTAVMEVDAEKQAELDRIAKEKADIEAETLRIRAELASLE